MPPIFVHSIWRFLFAWVGLAQAGNLLGQSPVISGAPLSKLGSAGQAVTFSVTATGVQPLSYQWSRHGQAIAGATGATFMLPSVARTDAGWYQVAVTNSGGTAKSTFSLEVAQGISAVVGWGDNYNNQATIPSGLGPVAAVAAGWRSFVLQADGRVVTWPTFSNDLISVVNSGAVSISSYTHVLAVRQDGTVVGYGENFYGQATVPAGLGGVVGVAAGGSHSMALKTDGTVVGWGLNSEGRATPPAGLSDVVAVGAGASHSLALKADGTVVAWGYNGFGQCSVPGGLTNVVAIAGGDTHSLALKSDGTVVAWGGNTDGQATVPAGLANVVRIAAGGAHNLALKADGAVVGWGKNNYTQATLPVGISSALGIAAGSGHSLVLVPAVAPVITKQPGNESVAPAGALMMTVTATGTRPLAYQWKKNGVPLVDESYKIAGSKTYALSISNAQAADAASYTVDVANAAGQVTSSAATLVVAAPPVVSSRTFSQMVTVGAPVTFSVSATGVGALTYQWRRNGQAIAGATGSTHHLPSATLADRGYYEAVITGANGGVARSVSYLNVSPIGFSVAGVVELPPWNGVPASIFDVVGIATGSSLSVALQRDGGVTEWGFQSGIFVNSWPASGGNGAVAISAKANRWIALQSDGGIAEWSGHFGRSALLRDLVAVSVSDYYAAGVRSDGAVVHWGDSYSTNYPVESAALSGVVAVATGNFGALALRSDGTVGWWHGSTARPPEGLSGVIAIAAGNQHFLALKSDGSVVGWGLSSAATVPAGLANIVAISAGYDYSLALKSDGTVVGWGALSNNQGTPPAGVPLIAVAGGGSHALALIPASAPVITTQPLGQTVSGGQNAVFSVAASGTIPFTYQWRKDGVNIPNATSSNLTLAKVIEADSGAYSVVVRNSGGTTTSANALLTVQEPNIAPVVRRLPQSVTVMGAAPATVSVVAGGAAPRSYQWYFGYPGDVSQPIAGETSASVTLASSAVSQRVWARITNSLGAVDSPAAVVLRWETVDPALSETLYDLQFVSYANGRFFTASHFYNGVSVDGADWEKGNSGGWNGQRVAYGNGAYVMGPTYYNSNVHTSVDGVAWTPQPGAQLTGVQKVVHNGRVFVAVTGQPAIKTSLDGLTWTQRLLPASYLTDVCHGNGLTIACGVGGKLYSSTDGLVWTERQLPTANTLRNVFYANQRFVTRSDAGEMWFSSDGANWVRQVAADPAFVAMGGGGGVFVGVAYPGTVQVSTDGLEINSNSNLFPAYGTVDLAYGSGRFLLTTKEGKLLRSFPIAGAITAQNQPAVPAVLTGGSATLSVATTGSGLQFQWYRGWAGDMSQPISGANSASYVTPNLTQAAQYWVRVSNNTESVDSSTFDVVIALPPTITRSPQSVDILAESPTVLSAAGSGPPAPGWQWFAGGRGNDTLPIPGATRSAYTVPPKNLSSTYWARAETGAGTADTAAATVTRWDVLNGQVIANQIVHFNGRYYAATGSLLSSADGRTWSPAYVPGFASNVKAVAHNGSRLVAVGDDLVVTSDDGVTFTRRSALTNSASNGALCFGNGLFVTTYGIGGTAWSPDGVTWTAGNVVNAPNGGSGILTRVCFGNGIFVAVGSDNGSPSSWIVYTSVDGKSWTKQPNVDPAAPLPLYSVGFGGGMFVAVGANRTILTSTDGVAWTRRSATSTNPTFTGVCRGNGVFLIGTSADECLRSSDGITWSSVAAPRHFSGEAVEFLNGQFIAAGKTGWVYASPDGVAWQLWSGWPRLGPPDWPGVVQPPKGLAIGGGKVVVVGGETLASGASTLFLSSNGTTWSAGNSPGLITSALVYGQGAFVCGANDGIIFRSTDATVWETILVGEGGDHVQAVLHNGRQFAAITSSRKIFLSDDGRNWTVVKALAPVTGPIASSGYVHVLARNRNIYLSTDWANWALATVPSSAYDIQQIVYGSGAFVAFNWSSELFVSADGATWTNGGSSNTRLAFAGGRFLTLSQFGHAWSIDGRSWQQSAFDTQRLDARGIAGRMPTDLAASGDGTTVVVGTPNLMIARREPVVSGIVEQPVGQIVQRGQSVTLRVVATGGVQGYQWFEGLSGDVTQPVVGAVADTLNTPVLAASRNYWVRVSFATYVQKSDTAHVEVLPSPVISLSPVSIVTTPGASATFSVTAAGTGALSYQWTLNGSPIAGATNNTYSIGNVQPTHVGDYAVTAYNVYGSAASAAASLRGPNPVPSITAHPQSAMLIAGQSASLTVTASGVGPLAFQWRRNGVNIPGATTALLAFAPATRPAAGIYDVTVGDGLSVATSQAARIQVAPANYPGLLQPDPSFTPRLETLGGAANGFLRLSDGRVFVFGSFSQVNGTDARNLARLNADGTVDAGYTQVQPNGPILAAALQSDGKLVVGGSFSVINGHMRAGLARLNGDGSVDVSFLPDGNYAGTSAIAVQLDGRIVVGGTFNGRLARTSATGVRDQAFAPAPDGTVNAIVVQSDGGIVVAGSFTSIAGASRGRIARFTAAGALDAAFAPNSGFDGVVNAMRLASGDRIVAGGAFTSFSGASANRIVRLTATGAIDSTWSSLSAFNNAVLALDVLADDRILAAGSFTAYRGSTRRSVARITASGALDSTFSPISMTLPVTAVTALGADSVIVGGAFFSLGASSCWNLARLSANGAAVIGAFGPGLLSTSAVKKIIPLGSGKMIVVGDFAFVDGVARPFVARLNSDGRIDPAFNPGGSGPNAAVRDAFLQVDGKIVIAGAFNAYNGSSIPMGLSRLNGDGTLDSSFASQWFTDVQWLEPGRNGRIYVFNPNVSGYLRRLNSDGSLDAGFDPGNSSVAISAIAEQPDGKIIVVGSFTYFNGARSRIVRLMPTGTVDMSFSAGTDGPIGRVALQPNGQILIAGDFLTVNGSGRPHVARLNSDGTLDSSFSLGTGTNGSITTLGLQEDGRMILTGGFSSVNQLPNTDRAARLLSNGSVDSSFVLPDPGLPPTTLVTLDDGAMLLAGGGALSPGAAMARLVPLVKPVVQSHPISQTVPVGATVFFSIVASSQPAPTYQWAKNGVPLNGATAATLAIANAAIGDAGTYTVAITNSAGMTASNGAVLTVLAPPAISTQPVAQTVNAGATASFSVGATGTPAPVFQWRRNGVPIGGATASILTLPNAQPSASGNYTVSVSNSVGSIVSASAPLVVNLVGSVPAISTQPGDQLVTAGQTVTFSVTGLGGGPLSYRWLKNGVDIAGATAASFSIASVQIADAGLYSVIVSNASGNVASRDAILSVTPAGFVATHSVVGNGYAAGGTVQITATIGYSGSVSALAYAVLIPPGWSYVSGGGAEGDVRPAQGAVDLLEWAWSSVPVSPVTFTYMMAVPGGTSGPQSIVGLATTRPGVTQFLAQPDPLSVSAITSHTADTGPNGVPDMRISLLELTRVIELYNTRNGTTRTGAYAVATSTTEDGFAPEPLRAAGATAVLTRYHSADSNRDGRLSLLELTRVIELYNYRAGTTRTGQYRVQVGTEDGFAPGP